MRTKLIRNLKRGDVVTLRREDGLRTNLIVRRVEETQKGMFSGKRRWKVIADNYPYWCPMPVSGYHDTKIEVVGRSY